MQESPFALYVYHLATSSHAADIGDKMFDFFAGSVTQPMRADLRIPFFQYGTLPELEDLQLEAYEVTAHVILVDDAMVNQEDWNIFLAELLAYTRNGEIPGTHILFPVALTEHAFQLDDNALKKVNFIRLCEVPNSRKLDYLLLTLSHQFCRLLYGAPEDQAAELHARPVVQLFLSHAKKGGGAFAKQFKDHVDELPGLNTFFDATEIGAGEDFPARLREEMGRSVLVVIHTDEFSQREWCRREVILGKGFGIPMLAFNLFDVGELRTFPYLGNVPHISLRRSESTGEPQPLTTTELDYALLQTLRETLRIKHHKLIVSKLDEQLRSQVGKVLPYAPELFSVVHMKKTEPGLVIYPDPPIGKEELDILAEIRPDLAFQTPTQFVKAALRSSGSDEAARKVGLFLSEINKGENLRYRNRNIQQVIIELSRFLLVAGVELVYSGYLKYEEQVEEETYNFAQLLHELVRTYRQDYFEEGENPIRPIKNFSAYPLYMLLSEGDRAALRKWVRFEPVEPPKALLDLPSFRPDDPDLARQMLEVRSFDTRYVWAKSLTAMRQRMLPYLDACIAMGGKESGFRGKMPGVLEEVLMAKDQEKPVFLIGGFGGVVGAIVSAFRQEDTPLLTNAYMEAEYHAYFRQLEQFNAHSLTEADEKVDYDDIQDQIKAWGAQGTAEALRNGLREEENQELFTTRNPRRIVFLVLKGLQNLNA